MRGGRRRLFTDSQCAELWRMYKAGESILGIGRGATARVHVRSLQAKRPLFHRLTAPAPLAPESWAC